MATWMAHIRLAQELLKTSLSLDIEAFLIGNIAPDSGVPNTDWSAFDPPKQVTHWREERTIQFEQFYDRYLNAATPTDASRTAFLLGYYCHLIADHEWAVTLWRPKRETPRYADLLTQDPDQVWEIKKDWYGLDFLYLADHPDSLFHTHFMGIETVPDYLDYFPAGAFTQQVRYIQGYYADPEFDLVRPYEYLSKAEMDDYIVRTTAVLLTALRARGWVTPPE